MQYYPLNRSSSISGTTELKVVGRIQSAPGHTSPDLYVTITPIGRAGEGGSLEKAADSWASWASWASWTGDAEREKAADSWASWASWASWTGDAERESGPLERAADSWASWASWASWTGAEKQGCDTTEVYPLRTEPAASVEQSWCLATSDTLGDKFYIASYPVPDRVLYASEEDINYDGRCIGKIDIVTLDQPLVQGAELPDLGKNDVTERNRYLWTLSTYGSDYIINAVSSGVMQSCGGAHEDPQPGSKIAVGHHFNSRPCEKYNFQHKPAKM